VRNSKFSRALIWLEEGLISNFVGAGPRAKAWVSLRTHPFIPGLSLLTKTNRWKVEVSLRLS
jgi:hypothetical protein